ncbi:MAG: hypothetical protein R2852_06660 [Bacteroidia bacterium]
MSLKRYTWKDWVVSLIALIGCLALFYPWQIVFIETSYNKIYRIFVELILILVLTYLYFRVAHYQKKWFIRIPVILLFIICIPFLASQIIFKSPSQNTYAVLYTKPQDSAETIKIIHYHGYLNDWNKSKHLVEYRDLGICIEKDFEIEDLNGEWYVHPDNPYHPVEGIARFKHGELMR